MKKLLILLVLGLVFSTSLSAYAVDFKGGVLFTTMSPPGFNAGIEKINKLFTDDEIPGYDIDKFEKLNNALGIYLQADQQIVDHLKVGLQMERLMTTTSFSLSYNEPGYHFSQQQNIGLAFNGILGVSTYQLNDYISLNGGAGYYFGNITSKYSKKETDWQDYIEEETTKLNGNVGFKAGATFTYPASTDLVFDGSIGYRLLSIPVEDDFKENFSGLEFKAGVSYEY